MLKKIFLSVSGVAFLIGVAAFAQPRSDVLTPLRLIQKNVLTLEQQLAGRKEKVLENGVNASPRLLEEINELELKLKETRANFVNAATGIELISSAPKSVQQKRDLYQELLQFIEPVFDGLRRVTEKPRRVEAYKTKIVHAEEELANYAKGLGRIKQLSQEAALEDLRDSLQQAEATLLVDRDELKEHLDTLKRQLKLDLQDDRSVFQEVQLAVTTFLVDEGKNLLVAALVCLLVLSGFYLLRPGVVRFLGVRASKTVQPLYSVFTWIMASLAVLVALYVRNDLFLVTLIVFFLVGFAWTSKALLRVFIHEVKLILNLGPVREGERVIWDGLPWMVKSLGFQSILVNPRFPEVIVQLPASVLVTLHSRSLVAYESWFPTQVGDFVWLDDGVYGTVEVQSPDQVILNTQGSRKYYTIAGFLQKNPMNCSEGFSLLAEVNVHDSSWYLIPDQKQQAQQSFEAAVQKRLKGWMPDASHDLPEYVLSVRPAIHAGPALESVLRLLVQCPGGWAPHRTRLLTDLSTVLVQAWSNT